MSLIEGGGDYVWLCLLLVRSLAKQLKELQAVVASGTHSNGGHSKVGTYIMVSILSSSVCDKTDGHCVYAGYHLVLCCVLWRIIKSVDFSETC